MALIKSHRRKILAGVFGADKDRVRPFAHDDRGEDRWGFWSIPTPGSSCFLEARKVA